MTLEELKNKYYRFILWYDPYGEGGTLSEDEQLPDDLNTMAYNLKEIYKDLQSDTSGDEDIENAAALVYSLLVDFREAGFDGSRIRSKNF